MENVLNDTDSAKELHSPPRRRRSTFFERRESIANIQVAVNDFEQRNAASSSSEENTEELSRYLEKLTKEKELWKSEYRERKNKYHDLKQQLAEEKKFRSKPINYSVLNDEDIRFLKSKPNVSKITESALELHSNAKVTMALLRRLHQTQGAILNHYEDKVNCVQKYILEHSVLEPID